MKIIKNSDKKLVAEIDKKLKENKTKYGYAYCPNCKEKTDETICICKEFVECSQVGPCHCGKYVKVEV